MSRNWKVIIYGPQLRFFDLFAFWLFRLFLLQPHFRPLQSICISRGGSKELSRVATVHYYSFIPIPSRHHRTDRFRSCRSFIPFHNSFPTYNTQRYIRNHRSILFMPLWPLVGLQLDSSLTRSILELLHLTSPSKSVLNPLCRCCCSSGCSCRHRCRSIVHSAVVLQRIPLHWKRRRNNANSMQLLPPFSSSSHAPHLLLRSWPRSPSSFTEELPSGHSKSANERGMSIDKGKCITSRIALNYTEQRRRLIVRPPSNGE